VLPSLPEPDADELARLRYRPLHTVILGALIMSDYWTGHRVRLRSLTFDDVYRLLVDLRDGYPQRYGNQIGAPPSGKSVETSIEGFWSPRDGRVWLAIESIADSELAWEGRGKS
jgi:hypothetical protein